VRSLTRMEIILLQDLWIGQSVSSDLTLSCFKLSNCEQYSGEHTERAKTMAC
jgi:hypothetical protein